METETTVTQSTEATEKHTSDTAETAAAETHSSETAETHAADTAATQSTEVAETQSTDTAETESTDVTETAPVAIGGTLFTGTADVDPLSIFGTDSPTSSVDWGTTVSAPASAPANDAGGSTSDTVAAPVAASAPQVSTAVDASPSAVVEASPSAAHQEVTATAASAPEVAAAPVSGVAAPTAVAPAAEAVPRPAAVCITSGNCFTVIQAMITLGAKMIIAPLTTISSWFGSVWYQADPEAAPRLSTGWNTAGPASASDLASLLMSAGAPAGLQSNTIRGGTSSTKVGGTVLDEINILDNATQTASSLMSSEAVSLPSAPRQFTGFVRHALEELVSSPSLMMLTLAALPGLGGIIIITGAGMRIGYRQAKFGFAMRSSGIARYVRSGPLGVVRTGSLIALRAPRTRSSPRFLREASSPRFLREAA